MFSSLKAFLVTIAMISFLMILGSFLHLQADVSGSASIHRENMAYQQPLLLSDTLSPDPRLDNNINNYNIYGIKHTSVDWVNSVQSSLSGSDVYAKGQMGKRIHKLSTVQGSWTTRYFRNPLVAFAYWINCGICDVFYCWTCYYL